MPHIFALRMLEETARLLWRRTGGPVPHPLLIGSDFDDHTLSNNNTEYKGEKRRGEMVIKNARRRDEFPSTRSLLPELHIQLIWTPFIPLLLFFSLSLLFIYMYLREKINVDVSLLDDPHVGMYLFSIAYYNVLYKLFVFGRVNVNPVMKG